MTRANRQPLAGLVVLDLTRVLAGPYCTMVLGDLGATIVKLERPGGGDDSRAFGPFVKNESGYFMSLNRGKQSVAFDLKKPGATDLFRRMVRRADVVVENYRPGTMERLGIGYEALVKVNPRLIYAAVSGFGHSGPYSQRPAYDIIAQAMGGLMSITGYPGLPPTRVGTSLGDILGGMFTAIGILALLQRRERTGKGGKVDVAMLDSVIAVLENGLARYFASGRDPAPLGSRHPSLAPFDIFRAKDGYLVIAIGNDKLWGEFCRAIGDARLSREKKYATNDGRSCNYRTLKPRLERFTRRRTVDQLLRLLDRAGIPCGPVNTVSRLVRDPQVRARRMIQTVRHPKVGKMQLAATPVKILGVDDTVRVPAPLLGQHTRPVLRRWLKVSAAEYARLQRDRVFG